MTTSLPPTVEDEPDQGVIDSLLGKENENEGRGQ
jgi:hypothetical protein